MLALNIEKPVKDDGFFRHYTQDSVPDGGLGKEELVAEGNDMLFYANYKHEASGAASLKDYHVKQRVEKQWDGYFAKRYKKKKKEGIASQLTSLQANLFEHMNAYKDICFCAKHVDNASQIMSLYTMHAMNHLYKTMDLTRYNSSKIRASKFTKNYRDQGVTRPRILFLCATRHQAFQTVKYLLAFAEKKHNTNVANKGKFTYHFYSPTDVPITPKPSMLCYCINTS